MTHAQTPDSIDLSHPIITPWKTGTQQYEVAIDKGVWTDPARGNRLVPWKLYRPLVPAGSGLRAPVVVWSHGLGGSRDGAGFISRALTADGYAVLHVQHAGTDSGLWEGKPGHPWDVIRATKIPRKATLQRFQDIPFALDQLEKIAAENPVLDTAVMGMSGHSFGALTTQIMAGQRRGNGRRAYRLHEPRFRAGLAYSPVPVWNKRGMPPSFFYETMETPMLIMTGTADDSPVEGFGYELRREVFDHAGTAEKHMLILNDGDHMVYNGSRGQLKENPKRQIHENIIVTASLAWWDAMLRGDENARAWLTGDGFASYLSGEGEKS